MSLPTNKTERIRQINDTVRQTLMGATFVFTPGVKALPVAQQAEALQTLRTYDSFTSDNDPYGEHDFGSFTIGTEKLFWKIDYYDKSMEAGSPDPSDIQLTTRVLTVMLSSEY